MAAQLRIVICGLSISSSWGNGHATTYRHLVQGLVRRGHRVLFLERDTPWYAAHRDLTHLARGNLSLYQSLEHLYDNFASEIRAADLVIVGSYVPEGIELGRWIIKNATGITAFYDIDTPITIIQLQNKQCDYLHPELIPRYDLYLSFTGGPTLSRLEEQYGSPCARPLYCSVDPDMYYCEPGPPQYDLGYMGTYSSDRQRGLERLLMRPAQARSAGRFIVAGAQYPQEICWPENVQRREHLPPNAHRQFYNRQHFTLNLTRAAMRQAGYSPSIRLFEAAACGTAIISDAWPGLGELFQIGKEILIARSARETLGYLTGTTAKAAAALGYRARRRVLAQHTGEHRAMAIERYVDHIAKRRARAAVRKV